MVWVKREYRSKYDRAKTSRDEVEGREEFAAVQSCRARRGGLRGRSKSRSKKTNDRSEGDPRAVEAQGLETTILLSK